MTKASLAAKARDFAWLIGIVTGFASATGAQYVTGGTRITALESRVTALERSTVILDAVALDLCTRTTDIRIRAPLECARREAGR